MGLKQFIAKTFFDFAYAIAYRPVSPSSEKDYLKGEEASFRLLKPTLRYWYADPLIGNVNGNEYLLPAINEVVKRVDIDENIVEIRPMKGIFEDED